MTDSHDGASREVPAPSVRNLVRGDVSNAVQVGHAQNITVYSGGEADLREPAQLEKPLAECSPYDLEVHRAIDTDERDSQALPAYVKRTHDAVLAEAVDYAKAGHSVLRLLVGGSSTGKTRACWEAVRDLPLDWRLWHPINPGRPEAALRRLGEIGPRTVLWLNETHHYLLTPSSPIGERVAAGIRDLLRDPARAPVLVLGTLWPEYWHSLMRVPFPGTDDMHSQARVLLSGASVMVPDTFTEADLLAARHTGDPRLVEAAKESRDSQVTQYLAGAPALLERYRNAPPPARAVLTAAMDARRLGHGLVFSPELLAAAAPGYLTNSQWTQLPDDWFAAAMDYVRAPCHGGTSPLVQVRPRPGEVLPNAVNFQLADYLEQTGRRERAATVVPASLWDASLVRAPSEDCVRLGTEAAHRCLYSRAAQFYARSDNNEAIARCAELFERLERPVEAREWFERAANAGVASAVVWHTKDLLKSGRRDDAAAWLQLQVDNGNQVAARLLQMMDAQARRLAERRSQKMADGVRPRTADSDKDEQPTETPRLADLLGSDEPDSPAPDLTELKRLAEQYKTATARREVMKLLKQEDRFREALDWLRSRADVGDPGAAADYAALLIETGNTTEAFTWYQRAAENGDEYAVSYLLRAARGKDELRPAAKSWLENRLSAGDTLVAMQLAENLAESSGVDDAITWLRPHYQPTDKEMVFRLARLWKKHHRPAEAAACLRESPFADEAAREIAELLEAAGRRDEAVRYYQRIAETGNTDALFRAVQLAQLGSRITEVIAWLRERADAGDLTALRLAAQQSARINASEDAIELYRRVAESGNASALEHIIGLLERSGNEEEAVRLRHFGIDPGGATAQPWTVP